MNAIDGFFQFAHQTDKENGELLDIRICCVSAEFYEDGSEDKIRPLIESFLVMKPSINFERKSGPVKFKPVPNLF